MNHRIVGHERPRAGVPGHPPGGGLVPGEEVQSQRFRAGIHKGRGFLQALDREHRQHGPKYLLLHGGGVGGDVGQHRGRNVQVLPVRVPAAHQADTRIAAGGCEQGLQAVPVGGGDDAAVVGGGWGRMGRGWEGDGKA